MRLVMPRAALQVQFATGSADLTPEARATLNELGRALTTTDLAGYRFRIEGYTDTVGEADLNQTLSSRRAEAVADYLTQTYHVDRARLQPVGMGASHPAVPTGPGVAEPRNRRVQVVNLGG
jgi:OOP family OmpA-OmpF porin